MRRVGKTAAALAGWAVAMIAAGCAGLQPAGNPFHQVTAPAVDRATIESRVTKYFSKTASVPHDATFSLVKLVPAPIPGWQEGRLEVTLGSRSQGVDFLVSNDGRYLFRGEVADLTVDPVKANMAKITVKNQPYRGNPNAPVTIVEFSDFECPFCAQASKTLESAILKTYDGKVKLVHKNLPLTQIHPWAETAAIAGECAFLQGNDRFWKVYDRLFQEQDRINAANLKEVAGKALEKAGGNVKKFDACIDDRATVALVQADVAEAAALGVNSTPTFFVNGRRVSGAQPLDGFKAVIEDELKRK